MAARLSALARQLIVLLSRLHAKAIALVKRGVKPGRTMPTLPMNSLAKGIPPKVTSKMDPVTQRSLQAQIDSGNVLAKYGFDVTHEPGPKPNGKEPDYLINGEYWDCYAPSGKNTRNMASEIETKVSSGQADRIVLNLDAAG